MTTIDPFRFRLITLPANWPPELLSPSIDIHKTIVFFSSTCLAGFQFRFVILIVIAKRPLQQVGLANSLLMPISVGSYQFRVTTKYTLQTGSGWKIVSSRWHRPCFAIKVHPLATVHIVHAYWNRVIRRSNYWRNRDIVATHSYNIDWHLIHGQLSICRWVLYDRPTNFFHSRERRRRKSKTQAV